MILDTIQTPSEAGATESHATAAPLLVGLCAWSSAGKGTIAQYLEEHHDFYTTSFAEPLYAMLLESGAMSHDMFSREHKDQPHDELGGTTPREVLQSLGDWYLATFGTRALISNVAEVWADLQRPAGYDLHGLVVSDCRTTAEIEWVQQFGGVTWWIGRDGTGSVNNHRTEHADSLQAALHRPGIDVNVDNNGHTCADFASHIENALQATRRVVERRA